jgi:hypothetical protein
MYCTIEAGAAWLVSDTWRATVRVHINGHEFSDDVDFDSAAVRCLKHGPNLEHLIAVLPSLGVEVECAAIMTIRQQSRRSLDR